MFALFLHEGNLAMQQTFFAPGHEASLHPAVEHMGFALLSMNEVTINYRYVWTTLPEGAVPACLSI